LVEVDPEVRPNTGRRLRVSDLGRRLLLNGNWDPFLEDEASLWLIHWLLATNPESGTTGHIVFSLYHRPDFSRREPTEYLIDFVKKHSLKVSERSLNREEDCFLRTYVPARSSAKDALPEDSLNCPLLQLNLIQPSPDGELYRFALGPKPSLPTGVVGFALGQYFERFRPDQGTTSVQQCL